MPQAAAGSAAAEAIADAADAARRPQPLLRLMVQRSRVDAVRRRPRRHRLLATRGGFASTCQSTARRGREWPRVRVRP